MKKKRIVYKKRKGFGKKTLFEAIILEEGNKCLKLKLISGVAISLPFWIEKKRIVILETFIKVEFSAINGECKEIYDNCKHRPDDLNCGEVVKHKK
jgi:hypothetical protein